MVTLAFESWANPTSQDQNADLFLYGLSSALMDSENDGMDDGWEMLHFGTLERDGSGDFDGDGVSDFVEFRTGTDPTDPESFFKVTLVSPGTASQGSLLSWPVATSKNYRIQFRMMQRQRHGRT